MSPVKWEEAGPNHPIYKTGLVVGGNYSSESSTDTKVENSTSESPKPETNNADDATPGKES